MDDSIEIGDIIKLSEGSPVELEIVGDKDEHGFYRALLLVNRVVIGVHEDSIVLWRKNP